MSSPRQSLLARFSVLTSVFTLVMVIAVAAAQDRSSRSEPGPAATTVVVTLQEFTMTPASITVPVGGKLHLTNAGTAVHNFRVVGTDLATADIAAGDSVD